MREIRTSGLMSGNGKRDGPSRVSTRAHSRLYCLPVIETLDIPKLKYDPREADHSREE